MVQAENEADAQVIRVARRVYVGNLSWTTSWQDLKDFFTRVGSVKYADVLREGGPGSRSKGCGVVEFSTPEEAAAAIQELNHAELDGRQIFVREDREDFELKGEPTGGGVPQKRPRSGPPGSNRSISIGRRLYIGNLSFETTWQQLKDHFRSAGPVLHADVMNDGEGRSKGCAVVEMENAGDALRAISLLSNSVLDGRNITVREDREDPDVKARGHRAVGAPAAAAEGTQVVVHGLPYRMAWQDLKDLCRSAGTVLRADVMTNLDGSSKGYGLVTFASQQDSGAAIAMLNGRVIDGRVITCKYDRFGK
jgi:RNA recognition motif-containing protein